MAKNFMIALVAVLVVGSLAWFISNHPEEEPSSPRPPGADNKPDTDARPQEPPKPAPPRVYTVAKSDSLSSIAEAMYGSAGLYKIIAAQNDLPDPDKIYPGQVLTIPRIERETDLLAKYERLQRGEQFGIYKVKQGDTFETLAKSFYDQAGLAGLIAQANESRPEDSPIPGTWLSLPNQKGARIVNASALAFRAWRYTVREEDTISSLSFKSAQRKALIWEINGLLPTVDRLEVGQKILLPDSSASKEILARP